MTNNVPQISREAMIKGAAILADWRKNNALIDFETEEDVILELLSVFTPFLRAEFACELKGKSNGSSKI